MGDDVRYAGALRYVTVRYSALWWCVTLSSWLSKNVLCQKTKLSAVFCVLSDWHWRIDVTLGLITEEEQKVLTELGRINRTDRIDSDAFLEKNLDRLNEDVKLDKQTAHQEVCPNVFYVPLMWAVDLVNKAYDENRINDYASRRLIIEVG